VADMDILRKIVLGEPSMFRDKDNRHKVTSSQSLWINPLNQFSLGLVEIKIDLEDRGRGPKAKYFI
jgi:hypothetical protein